MSETQDALLLRDQDITNMRHTIELIRTQIQARQVDAVFLEEQLARIAEFARLAQQEHQMLKGQRRFEILSKVGQLIGSSLDLQTVLEQAMDAVIQLTGAERGFLMLRDDDGGVRVAVARNFDQQTLTSDKFAFSRTIVNSVLDKGEPIVTTNATEDPRFASQMSIVGQALRSIMAAPLRVRGRVIGVAYVDNRAISGLFGPDDISALDTLTIQVAFAIENARLFEATDEELARRVEELTQLRRIDQQLNETLDPRRTMQTALEWVCRLAGAEIGHVGQLVGDPPTLQALYHYGVDLSDTQAFALEAYYPNAFQAIESRQIIHQFIPDQQEAVLIIPIWREQRLISVVVLRRQGEFPAEARDLVERVITRAAVAIENAQLYQKVQAADTAKSEFVGIVAHDLKVPMASIYGYSDLILMDGELSQRHAMFIGKIKDTVKRMEILVADLADISRIESGRFYFNTSRVTVDSIIQEIRDATTPQIKARNHNYIEQIESGSDDLEVDYYRLIQVLTNLISNAYKYTPEGGTITLQVRPEDDRITFSISDTGIGLSREQIAMLGTKFWRAEDDFTRSQPGTGLGFAITKALVELMGSSIRIESMPGAGSTFSFSVPIYRET